MAKFINTAEDRFHLFDDSVKLSNYVILSVGVNITFPSTTSTIYRFVDGEVEIDDCHVVKRESFGLVIPYIITGLALRKKPNDFEIMDDVKKYLFDVKQVQDIINKYPGREHTVDLYIMAETATRYYDINNMPTPFFIK